MPNRRTDGKGEETGGTHWEGGGTDASKASFHKSIPAPDPGEWLTVGSDRWRPSGERWWRTGQVRFPPATHTPAPRSTSQKESSGFWKSETNGQEPNTVDGENLGDSGHFNGWRRSVGALPSVCWSGQSGTGCGSEASSFEIAQFWVVDLSRTAGLTASNPAWRMQSSNEFAEDTMAQRVKEGQVGLTSPTVSWCLAEFFCFPERRGTAVQSPLLRTEETGPREHPPLVSLDLPLDKNKSMHLCQQSQEKKHQLKIAVTLWKIMLLFWPRTLSSQQPNSLTLLNKDTVGLSGKTTYAYCNRTQHSRVVSVLCSTHRCHRDPVSQEILSQNLANGGDRQQKGTLITPKATTVQAPGSGENQVCESGCVGVVKLDPLLPAAASYTAPSIWNSSKLDQSLTISLYKCQVLSIRFIFLLVTIGLTTSSSAAEWVSVCVCVGGLSGDVFVCLPWMLSRVVRILKLRSLSGPSDYTPLISASVQANTRVAVSLCAY